MSRPLADSSSRNDTDAAPDARRRWMGLLARAEPITLEQTLSALPAAPDYTRVRGPEVGLVMVSGRAGGTGLRFHLGEMTATRCTIRLADGTIGHAYVAGRRRRQAEMAALLDALLQDPARRPALERDLLTPIEAAETARRAAVHAASAPTRVEFFTVVRGEDD